jgi:hypothetical protein
MSCVVPTESQIVHKSDTMFPFCERADGYGVWGIENGLIQDRQGFVDKWKECLDRVKKGRFKTPIIDFYSELKQKKTVTINPSFTMAPFEGNRGCSALVCLAYIKGHEYICKIQSIKPCIVQTSNNKLKGPPGWIESLACHLFNHDLYSIFNIYDLNRERYYICMIIRKYETILYQFSFTPIFKKHKYKKKDKTPYLAILAQIIFCILFPLKSVFQLCHNDIHSDNIVITPCNEECLYVKLYTSNNPKIVRGYSVLRIPTHGCKFALIDYGLCSFILKTNNNKQQQDLNNNDVINNTMYYTSNITCNNTPNNNDRNQKAQTNNGNNNNNNSIIFESFGIDIVASNVCIEPQNTFTDIAQLIYRQVHFRGIKEFKITDAAIKDILTYNATQKPIEAPSKDNPWHVLYDRISHECSWNIKTIIPFILYFITHFGIPDDQVPNNTIVQAIDLDTLF